VLVWLSFAIVGVLIGDWCQVFLYKGWTTPEVVPIYLFIFIADIKNNYKFVKLVLSYMIILGKIKLLSI